MRSRIERDLKALENRFGVNLPDIKPMAWRPTSCPHEAAQQYLELINAGQYRAPAALARVLPSEAVATYRRLMG